MAAQNTTGEVLPAVGYVAERIPAEAAPDLADKRKGRQIASPYSQPTRAERNGIGERTQRKIDRLARQFSEHHEKVKSGELSVHRACIEVGIAKRTVA